MLIISLKMIMFTCLFLGQLHGEYTIRNGRLIDTDKVATQSLEGHFRRGSDALSRNDWAEAIKQFQLIMHCFPWSPLSKDALYYLAVSYYYQGEYDWANDAFNEYINQSGDPEYFESVMEFKYSMACNLLDGEKIRFFGMKYLPKWAPGSSMAIELLDEVIAVLPCHELAAKSLFVKAGTLWQDDYCSESIELYQSVIRRFPKHELALASYLAISKVYLYQSHREIHNSDLLALAQINLRKFQEDFPQETRVQEVETDLLAIKELNARYLYDTGCYYERKLHPLASLIYYRNAVDRFPETSVSKLCQKRISSLEASGISLSNSPQKEVSAHS